MKAIIPLITLILFISCGKIDTSGSQNVQLPNTRHDVVVQPDLEFMLNRFYKMCVYKNLSLSDAKKALKPNAQIIPEMEKCAFEKLDNFINIQENK